MQMLGFLSRLCGGEDELTRCLLHRLFLSRLCGGEGPTRSYFKYLCFLSRLCGGEEVAGLR